MTIVRGVGWVGLLGLAACFDPHPLPGAPCDELGQCPNHQSCVAGRCGGLDNIPVDGAQLGDARADAPDSAPPIMDRDGDLVADDDDNCPDLANPDQGDEDGDLVGDACDPCPIDVNNTTDPDGDGVAGACDPHPAVAGDRIVAFDGFHRPLTEGWETIGTGVQAGDDMVLTTVAGNHTNVVPPPTMLGNGMVMSAITVDSTVGSADSAIVVSMPYDPSSDHGVFCELDAPDPTTSKGRFMSLYDSLPDLFRGTRAFVWATATQYRIALTRTGNNYGCSVTANGGTPQTTAGSTDSAVPDTRASIGVYGANVHAAWMLVVTSP